MKVNLIHLLVAACLSICALSGSIEASLSVKSRELGAVTRYTFDMTISTPLEEASYFVIDFDQSLGIGIP
jgi:hypothetical protein